jgi:outer membrane protein assembly factor BamD (BamD/ComL family)
MGNGLLFVVGEAKGRGASELETAREFLRQEKFEKGIQELKRIQVGFAGSENAAVVPLNLGAAYLKLGLWDQASGQADDYLEQSKGGRFERYANYLKALALIGLGQGRAAEKALLEVRGGSGFGPPPEETAYHLARSAESQGDARRQLSYLADAEKGIRDPARLLWIRQRMGKLWGDLKDDARAASSYRASLTLCADSTLREPCAESTVRLADAAYRQRAYSEALSSYEELLRRHPRHKEAGWAQYQVGNLRRISGDLESALHAYQLVIDNYPDSYWADQARWRKDDAVWRKEYQGVLD